MLINYAVYKRDVQCDVTRNVKLSWLEQAKQVYAFLDVVPFVNIDFSS